MRTTLLRSDELVELSPIHPPSPNPLLVHLTPAERLQLRLGHWLITRVRTSPKRTHHGAVARERVRRTATVHRERELARLHHLNIPRGA